MRGRYPRTTARPIQILMASPASSQPSHTMMHTSCSIAAMLLLTSALPAQVDFAPFEYRKLDTRRATEQRMIDVIQHRPEMHWGPWRLLSPFPGNDRGMLAAAHSPEDELAAMHVGGPGPNLAKVHKGRNNLEIKWTDIGPGENRKIDLRVHADNRLNDMGTAYLYRTVTVPRRVELPVTMGSDDGLRFWLNGKLLIDADVPRGLDPYAHRLTLILEPGVNHLLCKVTQGRGGWDYQINTTLPMDSRMDAMLQYQLALDFPTREDAHYRAVTIPAPRDVVLEVGGLAVLPDGRPIVCTRRGEVWIITGAGDPLPFTPSYTLFASGLHEPLGLAVRQEVRAGRDVTAVYCVQRGELTRLIDTTGDDRANIYETVSDAWGVSGNYHEFAFGPKFDRSGDAWVTLNVGFCGSLGKSVAPYRGWAVRITPAGEMIPVCDGLRSPNGIGVWHDGAVFYVDNQGDYVGSNRMSWLAPNSWAGHPSTLRWREGWTKDSPNPPRMPATIWFPYKKMGQSTADIVVDDTGGKFGPFSGQIFVGDQTLASVMRVTIEKIELEDGSMLYQGACYPFREGLDCGVNRIAFDAKGRMFVGQTDRGWGSIGRRRHGVQRLDFTGVTPFEVLEMKVAPDGFVLEFTKDLDAGSAADLTSYRMSSYTYNYHAEYGSDEVDAKDVEIRRVEVLGPRTARLVLGEMRRGKGPDGKGEGYVHELHLPGVRDTDGESLLHPRAYYTLQALPKEMRTSQAR